MAKKKGIRKTARQNVSQRTVKFMPHSRAANVLALLAVLFLVLNSISLIFLKDTVIRALKDTGVVISQSELALLGLLWILMAFFAWSINRTVKEKQSKVSMWELFILSIICILSGRLESGVLLLIASVIYLVKAKKKR